MAQIVTLEGCKGLWKQCGPWLGKVIDSNLACHLQQLRLDDLWASTLKLSLRMFTASASCKGWHVVSCELDNVFFL